MQTQAHPKKINTEPNHRQTPTTHTKCMPQEPSIKGKNKKQTKKQNIPDPSPKNGIDLKHAVEFSKFGSH